MAVEDKGVRIPYDCDGSQKDFPFDIPVYYKADLKVYHRYTELGEEEEELLIEGLGYTLSSAYPHYRKGGVVSTTQAYPSPDKIVLLNNPELKQVADYERGDRLPSQDHENAMDRAYIALQKQRDTINLALKLMTTSSYKNLTLPDPVANMLMSWKDDLSGLKNIDFKAPSGSFTLTPFAETIFDDENAAAVRATIDALQDTIVTAFAKTFLDDDNAADVRATLEALQNADEVIDADKLAAAASYKNAVTRHYSIYDTLYREYDMACWQIYLTHGCMASISTSQACHGYAQVHLPDGAIVTSIKTMLKYEGVDTHNFTLTLYRATYATEAEEAMAAFTHTAQAADFIELEDTSIENATIDNSAYAYFIWVWEADASRTHNVYIRPIIITYTITKPLP